MSIINQPGCKKFSSGNVVIFECNLGRKPKIECSACGSIAEFTCDYPLRGSRAGEVCGRPLCSKCSSKGQKHLCGPHARLSQKKKER